MIRLICILLSITSDVTAKVSLKPKSKSSRKSTDDAYQLLAQSIQKRLNKPINSESKPTKYDVNTISSALRSLSTTQSALKKIDGTGKSAFVLVLSFELIMCSVLSIWDLSASYELTLPIFDCLYKPACTNRSYYHRSSSS